jgi:hypothetical protein
MENTEIITTDMAAVGNVIGYSSCSGGTQFAPGCKMAFMEDIFPNI